MSLLQKIFKSRKVIIEMLDSRKNDARRQPMAKALFCTQKIDASWAMALT